MTDVEYRDIPGWAGYRVGDDGSVWTAWHRGGKGTGKGGHHIGEWRKMKALVGKGLIAYRSICLRNNGGVIHRDKVHRLVLLAFVGPPPSGSECRHLDRNPANNMLLNLRWGTKKENADDKVLHGTMACGDRSGPRTCPDSYPHGANHCRAKLTQNKAVEIRDIFSAGGVTKRYLARRFKVSDTTIWRVIKRTGYNEERDNA